MLKALRAGFKLPSLKEEIHQAVNLKGATLVVFKLHDGRIFGGFTALPWTRDTL